MLHALIIGAILFVFGRNQSVPLARWSYYVAFLIKLSATMAVGYYYLGIWQDGDTLAYFRAAVTFNKMYASGLSEYVRALASADIAGHTTNWHSVVFIKLISPIVLLSGYNYWLTSLYLTLINFLFSWCALRLLIDQWGRPWLTYLAIFTLPSVVAWSGGVFKESLANGAFLLGIAVTLRLGQGPAHQRVRLVLAWLVLTWLTTSLRFYLGAILIGMTLTWIWFAKIPLAMRYRWLGALVLTFICFFGAQLLHPWLRPSRLPLTIYENYQLILQQPSSVSSFVLPAMQPTYWGLLRTAPLAWFTGLFRPLLTDMAGWNWLPFVLEKSSLLLLAAWSLLGIRSLRPAPVFYIGIFWLSGLAIALAMSTPNFGSLLRYQSAFLPFLFVMVGWWPLRKTEPTP